MEVGNDNKIDKTGLLPLQNRFFGRLAVSICNEGYMRCVKRSLYPKRHGPGKLVDGKR